MKSLSPTDDELENGENWELVNSNEAEGKQYIARKAIPIARILSLAGFRIAEGVTHGARYGSHL